GSNSNGSGRMLIWPGMTLSQSSDLCHTPLRVGRCTTRSSGLRSLRCVRHLEEAADSHPAQIRCPSFEPTPMRVGSSCAIQSHRETPSRSQGSPFSIILASNLPTGAEYASPCSYLA